MQTDVAYPQILEPKQLLELTKWELEAHYLHYRHYIARHGCFGDPQLANYGSLLRIALSARGIDPKELIS